LLLEAQLRALTMTLHHRTDAFRALMRETLDNLRYYFNTKNDVIVFASSGTGAMEGAMSNLLSPGERVLIGTAGKFGERWVQLAKAYGIESVVVEAPYGHPVPISEMKKHLETGGPFRAVFIQATESDRRTPRRRSAGQGRRRAAGVLLRRGRDHRPWHDGPAPGRVGN
jgi:aspartate aminotransferase-like enzyme